MLREGLKGKGESAVGFGGRDGEGVESGGALFPTGLAFISDFMQAQQWYTATMVRYGGRYCYVECR
jgi:hypothetical protein